MIFINRYKKLFMTRLSVYYEISKCMIQIQKFWLFRQFNHGWHNKLGYHKEPQLTVYSWASSLSIVSKSVASWADSEFSDWMISTIRGDFRGDAVSCIIPEE